MLILVVDHVRVGKASCGGETSLFKVYVANGNWGETSIATGISYLEDFLVA